jgi:hypothetical protein
MLKESNVSSAVAAVTRGASGNGPPAARRSQAGWGDTDRLCQGVSLALGATSGEGTLNG